MSINLKKHQQSDGIPQVAVAHRRGSEAIYATHNFCDATTWYSESARVVENELSKNGAVYESGDPCWVDLTHGKVFDEESLITNQAILEPLDPHGYAVLVETSVDAGANWVERPQRAPFAVSGGDYTVDYSLGEVTFVANDPAPGDLVRATYSKKGTSAWVLHPLPGKSLAVTKSEIQFSADVIFNDTIVMEVYGLVDIFAPHLLDTADPPGPLPSGTPIPIETTQYKTMAQLIDESVGFYPALPPLGGGSRGSTQSMYVLQFHYDVAKVVYDSLGMFLRISLGADTMFGGDRATATFYLESMADPGLEQALKELVG
jgi:hypothetical protein